MPLRGTKKVHCRFTAYGCSKLVDRQAGIIFRERARGSLRARQVIELGKLAAPVECSLVRKNVQHLGHPPRETLRLPHPPQTDARISVEQIRSSGLIECR